VDETLLRPPGLCGEAVPWRPAAPPIAQATAHPALGPTRTWREETMQNAKWDDVSDLDIAIQGVVGDTCTIYQNSMNMASLIITVQPVDKNHSAVDVDKDHLAANLWLVDYDDPTTKLVWKGTRDWSYTDIKTQFTELPPVPAAGGGQPTSLAGTPIHLYVYCCPYQGVLSSKKIGVLIKTDSGKSVYSSHDGKFRKFAQIKGIEAVTYTRSDVDWASETPEMWFKDSSTAVNFYLSCKNEKKLPFVTFSMKDGEYSAQSGYDGFIGARMWSGNGAEYKSYCGAFVWYREPHEETWGQVINFPEGHGNYQNWVKAYDKRSEYDRTRSLCVTWVYNNHGGDGCWRPGVGPIVSCWTWYRPCITAFDKYGNHGKFWLDARTLLPTLGEGCDAWAALIRPLFDIYDYPIQG
jgi:hypothetical protein